MDGSITGWLDEAEKLLTWARDDLLQHGRAVRLRCKAEEMRADRGVPSGHGEDQGARAR